MSWTCDKLTFTRDMLYSELKKLHFKEAPYWLSNWLIYLSNEWMRHSKTQIISHTEDRVFILSSKAEKKKTRIGSPANFKGWSFTSITLSTMSNSRHQSVASSHNAPWSTPVMSGCPPTQRPALPAPTLFPGRLAADVGVLFWNCRTFDLKGFHLSLQTFVDVNAGCIDIGILKLDIYLLKTELNSTRHCQEFFIM